MRVSRLLWRGALAPHSLVELDAEAAHYLRDVLRARVGAALTLFDGQGGEYSATVEQLKRDSALVAVGARQEVSRESPLQVHLGLGIARSERMDWAIQKAVELGVGTITPLLTERCVVVLKGAKAEQRRGHWQRVVDSACEQCGRTVVPEVRAIQTLPVWVSAQSGLRLLLDPDAAQTLASLSPRPTSITLMSGPEGGFSPFERELACAAEFIGVRLGPRILRTETASMAALAAMQTLWGDFP